MQSNSHDPRHSDLHKLIKKHYHQVIRDKALQGKALPFHIKREFERYLTCGIHAHGMVRFQCGTCSKDKFVAYSCKGRTICPRCNGRKMSDTARHLIEEVIPKVPVRQWVLSMPYKHRFILSSDQKLLNTVLQIFNRAISTHYKRKAKSKKFKLSQTGSVTAIQRFGGAVNLNIHFHTLFMDGVYVTNEMGEQRFVELIPTDKEIRSLTLTLYKRINRAFERRGYFAEDSIETQGELSLIKSQSVANQVDNYEYPEKIGKFWNPPFVEFEGPKCFAVEGFSLHANTKIRKENRSGLEKLCRYICRGALSKERISLDENGMVVLKLKSQYTDGTTHLRFTPQAFIKRIISLIPKPRTNMFRYHGVFAPRHKKRAEITSLNKPKKKNKTKKVKKVYQTPWAELLRRVFLKEVDNCDSCGSKLKYVASITSPIQCRKILDHLKMDQDIIPEAPTRGPPMEELMSPSYDDFDQTANW